MLLDCEAFEALYGGAAGGGKTEGLLMDAVRWMDVPGYSALMLRRTHPQLVASGGLVMRAHEWLGPTCAEWSEQNKRYTVKHAAGPPSVLQFGSLQYDRDAYNYQGPEFQRVYWDELTQWNEWPYTYIMSRIRRTVDECIPVAMRAASNPGGMGHDWVKARFVDPGHDDRPFLPAKLDDNPHVDAVSYRRSLSEMDPTSRQQLEHGLWVRDSGGLVYQLSSINIIPSMPSLPGASVCMSIDLGASQQKPTTAFVILAWHDSVPNAVWIIRSWSEPGLTPGSIADIVKDAKANDGVRYVVADAGALGRGYLEEWRQRHGVFAEAAEKRDKLGYRKLFNGALANGEVLIVEDDNQDLIAEMNALAWNAEGTDSEKGKPDHLTDAALYGWRRAKAHLARTPDHNPQKGTKEYYRKLEREMEQADIDDVRHQHESPWWQL